MPTRKPASGPPLPHHPGTPAQTANASPAPPPAPLPPATDPSPSAAAVPLLILLAPTPAACTDLAPVLDGLGDVHHLATPAQVVDLLTHRLVDLVILAPGLATEDGFTTCLALRQWREDLDLPIVFLCADARPELELLAFQAGCSDFIHWPGPPEVIRARLRQHLQRQTHRRARQRAEAQLRLSEARHRLIAKNAADVIWTMGLDGRFTYISPSVATLRGYSVAEVMSQTWADIFPPASLAVVQAEFQNFLGRLQRGEPLEPLHLELTQTHRDGHPIWTDIVASALVGMDGQFQEILGVTRDIDARKRAELALRDTTQRMEAMLNVLPDLMFRLDRDSQIIEAHPQDPALFYLPPPMFLGKKVSEVLPAPAAAIFQAALAEAAVQGRHRGALYSLPFPPGSISWFELSIAALGPADAMDREFIVLARDVTARQQAEAALQHLNGTLELRVAERTAALTAEISEHQRTEDRLRASEQRYRDLNVQLEREVATRTAEAQAANAAKSEFLAQMSHEIRTPLNGVLGLAQLLAREPLDERQRGMVSRIEQAGETLLFILNDILDLSKIEAGQLVITPQPCDLTALLDKVRDFFAPLAAKQGVRLHLDRPTELAAVEVDGLRLEQILNNLMSNALKFTPQGQVAVRAGLEVLSPQEAQVRCEVQDTGIGIAAADLAHLFEPFYQAGHPRQRRYGGTGLGLSICKRLVELMGGRIGAASQPGQGSTFWFELPVRHCPAPPPAAAADPPPAVSGLAGRRVLVVDDSEINREVVKQALELEGIMVTLAEEGRQALTLLRQRPDAYDAVLMDVQMPELDGLAVTRLIRTELGLTELPIIALTAGVLPHQRQEALDAGMNDVLPKPVKIPEMAALLGKWI